MAQNYPRRPPRIRLFHRTRPFFFLTFNTYKRCRILDSDELHQTFVQFCDRAHREYAVSVGRYVIMPDHIHLFVALPDSGIICRFG